MRQVSSKDLIYIILLLHCDTILGVQYCTISDILLLVAKYLYVAINTQIEMEELIDFTTTCVEHNTS